MVFKKMWKIEINACILEFVDVDSIKTFMRKRGIQTLWAWKNSCEKKKIKI
jgi:hypothetical protein